MREYSQEKNFINLLCSGKWINEYGNTIYFTYRDAHLSYIDEPFGVVFETDNVLNTNIIGDDILYELSSTDDFPYEVALEKRIITVDSHIISILDDKLFVIVLRRVGNDSKNIEIEHHCFHLNTEGELIVVFAKVDCNYNGNCRNYFDLKEICCSYKKQL